MTIPIDLPPTEADLFGHTTCGYDGCTGGTLPKSKAVTACLQIGQTTIQEHFCSNQCRDKWRDQYARDMPYDPA